MSRKSTSKAARKRPAKPRAINPVKKRTQGRVDALLPPTVRAAARNVRQERKRAQEAAKAAAEAVPKEAKPKVRGSREHTEGTKLRDAMPDGKQPGGPAGHAASVEVATDLHRRYQAWELKLSGATYQQIADTLKVSKPTVVYDVHEVMREYQGTLMEEVPFYKSLAIAETYKLQLAMMKAANAGDHRAAAIVLECIKVRAKLQGTYAPIKIAPTDPSGTRPFAQEATDALRAEVARYFGLPMVEQAQAPVQAQLPERSKIPVYDPAQDGPDEPVTITTQAVAPETNGHKPDDYNGEGGS